MAGMPAANQAAVQSGYGKDMGIYSLYEYTQIKHVMASHD